MTRFTSLAVLVVAAVLLIPAIALAQASIAGTVKDSSGGVLPGVTVEAASPVLIEKVRTATTDGRGQYQIIDLRPGEYTVTFTLGGFNAMKREGIALSGAFTATVDADLRVGAQEETITVTAAATTIDLQNATRQRVVTAEVIDALPTSRVHSSLATLIPGVKATSADIGGTTVVAGLMQGHGTKGNDSRIMTDGISVAGIRGTGGGGQTTPNIGAMQEMTFDYAGAGAENLTGGIRVNLVPREGGNAFKGSSFASFANSSMQGNNLTSDLLARGLLVRDSIKSNLDFNPGVGGPIKQDKLWFYVSYRAIRANNYVGGLFEDRNAANPAAWTFDPDPSRQVVSERVWNNAQVRTTWQITQRNKLSMTLENSPTCQCPSSASATVSKEAATNAKNDPWYQGLLNYSSPLTNRVLLEAGFFYRWDGWYTNRNDEAQRLRQIPVTEQSTGFTYRGTPQFTHSHEVMTYYRAAVSYVTGSHNVKVGFNNNPGTLLDGVDSDNPLSYRVNRPISLGGVPNQLTLRANPFFPTYTVGRDLGIFAQDRWTIKRLTLNYGFRYDNLKAVYPVQRIGPTPLAPNRDITFPEAEGQNWRDLSPRSSLAFDVFGNQKTALKVSMNRYVAGYGSAGPTTTLNPVTGLVNLATRSWTDANVNFVPDCDILNPISQDNRPAGDFCGTMSNSNFGTNVSQGLVIDPDLKKGWGKREFSWEFSTGVQHELREGVAIDVSYYRRWYGNFTVTDDQSQGPENYDLFQITAPTDTPFSSTAPAGTQLPGGGGYVIGGLYNLNPARFGQPASNIQRLSDNYGRQIEHWNGVDISVSARLANGLRLQGGTSTGRTTTNSCEVREKLPESAPTSPFCATNSGWLTDVKGFVTYTIPKIDVLVSTTFQSIVGPVLAANYTATNAVINRPVDQGGLGRNLSGTSSSVTVPLFAAGTLYGDRLHQMDFRVGKVVRIRGARAVFNVDVFNVLNSNAVLSENSTFDVWRKPSSILMARFVKVGVQFDF